MNTKINQAESYILDSFIKAVGVNFRPTLIYKNPKSIEEAYEMLRELEMSTGFTSYDDKEFSQLITLINSNNDYLPKLLKPVDEDKDSILSNNTNESLITCQFCNEVGHIASNCPQIMDQDNNFQRNDNLQDRQNLTNINDIIFNPYNNGGCGSNAFQHGQINHGHQLVFNSNNNPYSYNLNSYGNNFNSTNGPNSHVIANPYRLNQRYVIPSNYNLNYLNVSPQSNNVRHFGQPIYPYSNQQQQYRPQLYQQPPRTNFTSNMNFQGSGSPTNQPMIANVNSIENGGASAFVFINVDKRSIQALLDTGSQINLIKKSFVSGRSIYSNEGTTIKGINGCSKTYGSIIMQFSIGNADMITELFHIVDDHSLGDFYIYFGSNFFSRNGCLIDYPNKKLKGNNFECDFLYQVANNTQFLNTDLHNFNENVVRPIYEELKTIDDPTDQVIIHIEPKDPMPILNSTPLNVPIILGDEEKIIAGCENLTEYVKTFSNPFPSTGKFIVGDKVMVEVTKDDQTGIGPFIVKAIKDDKLLIKKKRRFKWVDQIYSKHFVAITQFDNDLIIF